MRTILVNPSKSHARFNPAANPSRVIIVATRRKAKARKRGRRRNPLIVPANANPLILPASANRGRRRRRGYRRNPAESAVGHGSARFDMTRVLTQGAYTVGGGAISYAINKMVINNLGTDAAGNSTDMGVWLRQAVRLILAGMSASMIGGGLGLGAAGGMGYGLARELDSWWQHRGEPGGGGGGAGETSADLEAALGDVLDGF